MTGKTSPDLTSSGGHINPMMATFDTTVVAAQYRYEPKSFDECLAREKELTGVLYKVTEQMPDEKTGHMNLEGITEWSGTNQEKAHKLIEIHSELTGVRRVIDQKRQAAQIEEMKAEKLIKDNHSAFTNDDGPINAVLQRKPLVSETLSQICQDTYKMSLGDALADRKSKDYILSFKREFEPNTPGHEFRATLFNTDSWDPFVTRQPGWTPQRTTPLQVSDVIPMFMTGKDAVQWMEETAYNPAAAETAEGGQAPEAGYALTERNQPVQRIAHWIPVTEEALADEPQVRSYLDYVMPLGVRQRLDGQIINGDGTSSNLAGLLSYGAKTDRGATAQAGRVMRHKYTKTSGQITKPWSMLLTASYLVKDHGFGILGMQSPTHAILHPNVYLECLLSESSSGGYYVGGPASPLLGSAWGMTVIETNHLTDSASTAGRANHEIGGIIGDFSPTFVQLYMRHEVMTEMGRMNDDFRRFQWSIRSSVRCVLAVTRASAFAVLINPLAAGTAPGDS